MNTRHDVVHLTHIPPAAAGSYNRWVGVMLRQDWGFSQAAISYDPLGRWRQDGVIAAGTERLGFRKWLQLHLPERLRGFRTNGISSREALRYLWSVQRVLPRIRPRVVVCYDGYKLGPALRSVIDWPCRLVLSQRGLSYMLDTRSADRLYSLASFDAVWTLSRAAYQVDRQRGSLYEPPVTVLPSGVDTGTFAPVSAPARVELRGRFGLPPDAQVVLMLSRMVPKKGAHLVLESWPRILQRVPHAFLWIVGGAPPAYEARLKSTIAALGLCGSVRLQGRVEPQMAAACFQAADLYVFPPVWAEGMGQSLAQAMSTGLPCVCSDGEMFRELFGTEALHLVPDPNLEDAFVEPIAHLLEHPEAAGQLGRAARGFIEREHSEPIALARVRAFLERQLTLAPRI